MDIAGKMLSRTKSLDEAIQLSEMMAYTAHMTWDRDKYTRTADILREMKRDDSNRRLHSGPGSSE